MAQRVYNLLRQACAPFWRLAAREFRYLPRLIELVEQLHGFGAVPRSL